MPVDPHEGLLPEENTWLDQSYEPVSEGFVDDTLRLVMQDRQEIEREAEQVEDIQLPADLLAALEAPQTADGFVNATLAKVVQERSSSDRGLSRLLDQYEVPEVSEGFVDRTLTAIQLGQVEPEPHAAPAPIYQFRRWAAAAAILIIALLVGFLQPWNSEPTEQSFASSSHLPFATQMAAQLDELHEATPVDFGDDLQTLVAMSRAGR